MAGKRLAFREKFGIQKASEMKPTKYLRTGFIRIDNARAEVGRLGFKKGGITVVYGQTGAGKSTLTYQTMAHAQQHDEDTRPWLVADVETSFDALYAASRGVDLERVDVLPIQDWADSTFEAVRQAILSEEYSGIIIDSIHGQAVSRDDKSIEEEKSVGALPMKLTQFIQNTKAAVYKTGIVMILIGQVRRSNPPDWWQCTQA